jgi:cell division protease FtsH
MKYETIDADQIDDIMNGRPAREPKDWNDGGSGVTAAPEPDKAESGPDAPIGGPAREH